MSDLKDAFIKLLDRHPSDKEIQDLYKVKDALGLSNNDALWQVLLVLQHYENKYELFPARIEAAASRTLNAFQTAADANAKAAMASATRELSRVVQEAASTASKDVSSRDKLKWLTYSTVAATSCALTMFCAGYYLGYEYSYRTGFDEGYSQIKSENALAAWGNSSEGQIARKLALTTDIQRLAKCQGKGWVLRDKYCIPKDDNGVASGWAIP